MHADEPDRVSQHIEEGSKKSESRRNTCPGKQLVHSSDKYYAIRPALPKNSY